MSIADHSPERDTAAPLFASTLSIEANAIRRGQMVHSATAKRPIAGVLVAGAVAM
jgi:hypothetical protein